nr:histone-lysine N-methyltransferase SETMAR-like [Danaus plexippus plexippus]
MAVSNAIIRACLLYKFKLGSKAAEACRKICIAFGESAVAERTSQKWFKKFVSGIKSLEDEPHSGVPSTIKNKDIKLPIKQDSNQTCQALALFCKKTRSHHWLSSEDPLPLTANPNIHQQKILLCDNVRPNTARVTQETLARLEWEVLPHPPYSPDLTPSYYHLFLALDNHMRNWVFPNREALENNMVQFFNSQKPDFYKKVCKLERDVTDPDYGNMKMKMEARLLSIALQN